MIRRFFKKLTLFAVPGIFVLLTLLGATIYVGEMMPINNVINQQLDTPGLIYGTLDTGTVFPYKLQILQAKEPEILLLGSSRMLQFRAEFMNREPSAVYNASGPGWTLKQARTFLESIAPENRPIILIIGIDQPWFSPNYKAVTVNQSGNLTISQFSNTLQQLVGDMLNGSLFFDDLIRRQDPIYDKPALGLRALQIGFGYRNDGSLLQAILTQNMDMQNATRASSIQDFQQGVDIQAYTTGGTVSETALEEFRDFLAFALEGDTVVIGILLPYLPTIYKQMQEQEDYHYIEQLSPQIQQIFDEEGGYYFDFSDALAIGGSDTELYDGWHSTELLTLRMYANIVESLPEVLGDYSDLSYLRELIANTDNPMDVLHQLP